MHKSGPLATEMDMEFKKYACSFLKKEKKQTIIVFLLFLCC